MDRHNAFKDLHGACSWVKHHRKPALCPIGRACQGREQKTFTQLLCCRSSSLLCCGGPRRGAGGCADVDAGVVIDTGWIWSPWWHVVPALAGHKVVRLMGTTAAAVGWGLTAGAGCGAWAAHHQCGMQAPCRRAVFLPVLLLGPGAFTRISSPLTGAAGVRACLTTSLQLWSAQPFICRAEQCSAWSGPLVFLTFRYVNNKTCEQWALATAWG